MWLLPAVRTLVTLACVQSGLPGATGSAQPIPPISKVEKLIAQARAQFNAGHFTEALTLDRQAAQVAHRTGDLNGESRALLGATLCQGHLGRFHDALQSGQASYALARRCGNNTWAGAASGTLATIYRSLGEYALAQKEGELSINLLKDDARRDYLAESLLYLADLAIEQGHFQEGAALCSRAVDTSRKAKLPEMEASAWDIEGFALLKAHHLPESERALKEAQAVRENGKENGWSPVILGHLSELELRKGRYAEALRLNTQAFANQNSYFRLVPSYYFVHIRAQILVGLNRKGEALGEFRRAVGLADTWREAASPGDSTNTQTVVFLNEVYHDFASLAAEMALAGQNQEFSREALEALAKNRAASLREQLAANLVRDPSFSERYFKLLTELQAAQGRVTLGGHSAQDTSKLESIRLELSELEDQSLSVSTKKEKYQFQNSLKGIQARLHRSEVLLSFCLGKTSSYLWAVTVDDVQLQQLPGQADIEQRAKRFSEALQNGHDGFSAGYALSESLFGQLSAQAWGKRDWLITEDGASAGQIPYAALSEIRPAHSKQTLVAEHSLRILPSELLLLLPETANPQRRFVGVGDPIYNLADTRRAQSVRFVTAGNSRTSTALGRLAGSEQEVKTAAQLSGMPTTEILTGASATGEALRKALDKVPELLHFAVHVVSPDGKPQEAALALSLTSDGLPELLTREAIAGYRVPGSLVILSGCSSGQGKALPSAGLIGLSRAWLLAGAAAVVVSAWPIPDDSGELFSAFYRHLQKTITGSLAQRAAIALQEAQLDMQRSSGYRNSPSFWAAYSILSKE